MDWRVNPPTWHLFNIFWLTFFFFFCGSLWICSVYFIIKNHKNLLWIKYSCNQRYINELQERRCFNKRGTKLLFQSCYLQKEMSILCKTSLLKLHFLITLCVSEKIIQDRNVKKAGIILLRDAKSLSNTLTFWTAAVLLLQQALVIKWRIMGAVLQIKQESDSTVSIPHWNHWILTACVLAVFLILND